MPALVFILIGLVVVAFKICALQRREPTHRIEAPRREMTSVDIAQERLRDLTEKDGHGGY